MKIPVGILGATGVVGQQYVKLLQNHPWFEITYLAASENSSGRSYREALENKHSLFSHLNEDIASIIVDKVSADKESIKKAKDKCAFLFSALDSKSAKEYEERYAKQDFPIISNASAHRKDEDVPMIIPEINPHHLKIIPIQQWNRGFNKGFIITKPNCSIQSYLTPLYAIHRKYPLSQIIVTTMQSLSGAGWPGIASLDALGNITPYIDGEEEKSEEEPLKILGEIAQEKIVPFEGLLFSASCNRVPVLEGHMATLSMKFLDHIPDIEEMISLWNNFIELPQKLNLPSAPKEPIIYKKEAARPQIRLDLNNDKQMATTVGRLRECRVLDYKFTALSHNTVRGAAGGGILNAELLKALEYL